LPSTAAVAGNAAAFSVDDAVTGLPCEMSAPAAVAGDETFNRVAASAATTPNEKKRRDLMRAPLHADGGASGREPSAWNREGLGGVRALSRNREWPDGPIPVKTDDCSEAANRPNGAICSCAEQNR
jgi:hypothetical protein